MCRIEDIVGADHALQRVLPLPPGYVDEVDDGVHTLGGGLHLVEVADIADNGIGYFRHLLAVEAPQLVPVPQSLCQHGADGAGRPCDQYLHGCCSLC